MIASSNASRLHHQRTDLMIAPVWGGRQKSIWSIDPPIMTVFRELDWYRELIYNHFGGVFHEVVHPGSILLEPQPGLCRPHR